MRKITPADNPVLAVYMADPEVQKLTEETLSGNGHYRAWCAIIAALNEFDPSWDFDDTKSAVENVVTWIESKATK